MPPSLLLTRRPSTGCMPPPLSISFSSVCVCCVMSRLPSRTQPLSLPPIIPPDSTPPDSSQRRANFWRCMHAVMRSLRRRRAGAGSETRRVSRRQSKGASTSETVRLLIPELRGLCVRSRRALRCAPLPALTPFASLPCSFPPELDSTHSFSPRWRGLTGLFRVQDCSASTTRALGGCMSSQADRALRKCAKTSLNWHERPLKNKFRFMSDNKCNAPASFTFKLTHGGAICDANSPRMPHVHTPTPSLLVPYHPPNLAPLASLSLHPISAVSQCPWGCTAPRARTQGSRPAFLLPQLVSCSPKAS